MCSVFALVQQRGPQEECEGVQGADRKDRARSRDIAVGAVSMSGAA